MSVFDKFQGFKTIAFNVAVAVAGALGAPEVVDALNGFGVSTDDAVKSIIGFVVAGNILLRAVTKTGIFKKV